MRTVDATLSSLSPGRLDEPFPVPVAGRTLPTLDLRWIALAVVETSYTRYASTHRERDPARVRRVRTQVTLIMRVVSAIVGVVAAASMLLTFPAFKAAGVRDVGVVQNNVTVQRIAATDGRWNDTSRTLSKNAAAKLKELSKLKGAAFDKAYVDNEVAYHKAVDNALETLLIPSASNDELKNLLQTGLKIFQGHEQHAEQVAAGLK